MYEPPCISERGSHLSLLAPPWPDGEHGGPNPTLSSTDEAFTAPFPVTVSSVVGPHQSLSSGNRLYLALPGLVPDPGPSLPRSLLPRSDF